MAQYDPNKEEIWKPINGFDKYFISNQGRVKSYKSGKENILNPKKFRYKNVTLRKEGKGYTKSIHRLVALHFLNDNDLIKHNIVVDHKFGDTEDNSLQSLQLISQRANTLKGNISNKSGYVGVSWRENRKSWRVRILYNKKRVTLGSFKNKEDAIELHKQFFKDVEADNFNLEEYITNRNIRNSIN
jgi:hypothetical protein